MDKREYFFAAMAEGCYKRKSWIIDCFAITSYTELPNKDNYPYRLATLTDGTRYCWTEDKWESVTGGVSGQPLFDFYEEVTVTKEDGIANFNQEQDITTDYGTVLRNCIILVYPFVNKIGFQHNPFDIGKIEKIIATRMVDEPASEAEKNKDDIYPSEYIKYSEAIGLIRGCSYFISPSGSEGTMVPPKEVIALRDKLLEEYKDKLNDPATIALIATECVALDKELMKKDPSNGFFTSGKQFDVVRMKMFVMLGIEPSLATEVPSTPIVQALSEGWDVDNLVNMINGQRYGSYARGKLTEFGGTVVKLMLQAFRDARITEDDCGATGGLPVVIRDSYINLLQGIYIVGNDEPTTIEELRNRMGETIEFRSPTLCKAENNGVCAKCIGDNYSKNPRSVAIAMLTIGSIFMGRFMAAMHGKAMETRLLNVNEAFS